MRAIIVLLAVAVLVLAACLYAGIININQTRPGVVQAPAFQADVGRVTVGKEDRTVTVPTIAVQKPGEQPGNAQ